MGYIIFETSINTVTFSNHLCIDADIRSIEFSQ